jgi:KamA family protein
MINFNENLEKIKYKAYTRSNLDEIEELSYLPERIVEELKLVSLVLPFKTNSYVVKELINWKNIPNDPIYQLNFPRKKMFKPEVFEKLRYLANKNQDSEELQRYLDRIYKEMNPHPGGQICYNTPKMNGRHLKGIQHKYRETMLFFPSEGQTCHSFCTYCFRWAQFIGKKELKLSINDSKILVDYLMENDEVQEVLFTGGDPMVMKANKLAKYIDPLLVSDIENLKSIRIGTKSLSYWPYRYLTDKDSEEILELFKRITEKGIHLTLVANFNHPNELRTAALKEAVKKINSTGAIIRTQSPILKGINDHHQIWINLIRKQVNLGMIPYYMFITRDTGVKDYFDVSLVRAFGIYTKAYRNLSGLCRTLRGPVMSTLPGKVHFIGITNINNKRVIALKFIQARNPKWVGKLFYAKYNPNASWLDELEPAFNDEFFYEKELSKYLAAFSEHSIKPLKKQEQELKEIASET